MKKYIHIALGAFFVALVSTAAPAHALAFTFSQPLGLGSRGSEVAELQTRLVAEGVYAGPITGYFGPMTKTAVSLFQISKGLEAIGSVGPLTRKFLNTSLETAQTGSALTNVNTIANSTNASQMAAVSLPIASEGSTTVAAVSDANLPYRAPSFSQWEGMWGKVTRTAANSLLIEATASTTGAGATFPASKNWTDYRYTANLIVTGGDITLYGRYVDEKNFAACTFGGNRVAIVERVNGKATTVASAEVPSIYPGVPFHRSTSVTLRVKGSTIGCSELGPDDNVTYTHLDSTLSKGGIGVETWLNFLHATSLELQEVHVESL